MYEEDVDMNVKTMRGVYDVFNGSGFQHATPTIYFNLVWK